jgi:hypothetical protein
MSGHRKLRLEPSAEFGDWDLPELGHPTGVFRGRDRLTAITSRFGHLYWPGRAIYGGQRLTERLSIYRGSERVAVFDDARYWINDVCFHPTKPWAIVGTGNYDGGYQFEGALLIFDYEANEYWSVLEEDREVTRCRFENDDLVVLLRPRHDQEFEADDEFAVFVGTRLTDLRPGDQNRRAHALLDPGSKGSNRARHLTLGLTRRLKIQSPPLFVPISNSGQAKWGLPTQIVRWFGISAGS